MLSEFAPAPWQMHLDEQAAFVAFLSFFFFFFFFLWSETFLLNSANLPRSNETLRKKKKKEEKQDWILKAAC